MQKYPGGGGDYQVAKHNLGNCTAAMVAGGFLIDYALTVVLCLGMAVRMFSEVAPKSMRYATLFVFILLALVVLVAIRGFSQPAWFTLTPTLIFGGVLLALIIVGIPELARGNAIATPSATYGLTPTTTFQNGVGAAGFASILMVLAGYVQQPILVQLTDAIFKGGVAAEWIVGIAIFLVLIVTAVATFISFPALMMHLAKDGFLPHRLSVKGRRFTHNGGIVALSLLVVFFVVITRGSPVCILSLYALRTLWFFSVTQVAMIKHGHRHLAAARTPAKEHVARCGLALAGVTLVVIAGLLLCVLITKFMQGGWIVLLLMVVLSGVLVAIGRHYAKVKQRLVNARWQGLVASRAHALVIVDGLHLPTRRTLAYARATQLHAVEAITANVDDADTRKLMEAWTKSEFDTPLKVLESPYHTSTEPIIRYIRRLRAYSPRDVVNVYTPELVVSYWWQRIAHNELLDQLKRQLVREGESPPPWCPSGWIPAPTILKPNSPHPTRWKT